MMCAEQGVSLANTNPIRSMGRRKACRTVGAGMLLALSCQYLLGIAVNLWFIVSANNPVIYSKEYF